MSAIVPPLTHFERQGTDYSTSRSLRAVRDWQRSRTKRPDNASSMEILGLARDRAAFVRCKRTRG